VISTSDLPSVGDATRFDPKVVGPRHPPRSHRPVPALGPPHPAAALLSLPEGSHTARPSEPVRVCLVCALNSPCLFWSRGRGRVGWAVGGEAPPERLRTAVYNPVSFISHASTTSRRFVPGGGGVGGGLRPIHAPLRAHPGPHHPSPRGPPPDAHTPHTTHSMPAPPPPQRSTAGRCCTGCEPTARARQAPTSSSASRGAPSSRCPHTPHNPRLSTALSRSAPASAI